MTKAQAIEAVESIIDDLSGRLGLGNEWDKIDGTVCAEIRDEWARRILLVANGD